jgi:zinc protease
VKNNYKAIFLVCALSAPLVFVSAAAAAPIKAIEFPQEHSDLRADPAAHYGRLPNGLTYIIRKNTTPAGTATVYMRVGAGSMMETAAQKGLAHFTEHMAFKGTTHIPAGELKNILERHGFAFGVDANAYTTASKTVYALQAPKNDDETLDTALFMMREVAGNMTLDPGVIDPELGVILGEERLGDKPTTHRNNAWIHQLYAGQRFADFSTPIGSVDVLRSAPRSELAAFYSAWYRPELTTLILVGDFDPAAMENKIKAKFSDWPGGRPMPADIAWGTHAPKGIQTFSFAEKGITEEMGVTWIAPADESHDSLSKEIGKLQDGFVALLLNRRYQIMFQAPNTAFLSASFGSYDNFETSHNVFLSVVPKPGKTRPAFEQAYGVLQSFTAQGVTAQEASLLQTVLPVIEKNLTASYQTRTNADIASALLGSIDADTVEQALDDKLKAVELAKPKLSQIDLNARLKTMFDGDGPVLSHSGETLGDFDEAAMKADYTTLTKQIAATYKEAAKKAWPYTDFGPAATPVSHSVDKDFGYTHYVYPNGMTLNIKPTKLSANQVLVEVDFPGGLQSFDPKSGRPFAVASGSFFAAGGLNKLTVNEINDALPDKVKSLGYALGDGKTLLQGVTTSSDLPTQLQLLMAYATDLGSQAEGFERFKAYVPEYLKTLKASPAAVLDYNIKQILLSGDPRYDQSVLEHIDPIKYDDVRSIFSESLKDTPIAITIVGDVDEAEAVADVGKTFGTVPQRPTSQRRFPGADHVDFPPKQHDFTLYHEGRDDQSISLVIWPTNGFYADTKMSRGVSVLADVLKNRLFEEIREKQGIDYAPTAESYDDEDYSSYGYIAAKATIKAGGDAGFRGSMDKIVADLKTHPIGDDELLRVEKPIRENFDNEAKNNNFWLSTIVRVDGDRRARNAEIVRHAEYEAVTAQDVMRLAQKYLRDETAIHIKVVPTAKASAR